MTINFKDKNSELKLNSILYCITQANEQLNKCFAYDDRDINALSSVFNIPKSDIKKIYQNYFELVSNN